ncbi:MAG: DUF3043 domain-containing protein [Actinobacteria bacterium]|nr:DUF3043 domain-containing protein [Actinomycetota bacterium]
MFGRKKNETLLPAPQPEPDDQARGGAKNRPTPKRREAQAARMQPLVPADRKAAARTSKEAERAERVKRQAAMRRGEEWALLPRDRGPARAFVRDFVDSRWNIGEFLLPAMLLGMPFMFIDPTSGAARIGFSIVYGAFAVFIVDTFVMWIQLRRRYAEEFGTKPPGGSFFYAMSRTMSFRRTRMPQPRVSRGQRWVKPGK